MEQPTLTAASLAAGMKYLNSPEFIRAQARSRATDEILMANTRINLYNSLSPDYRGSLSEAAHDYVRYCRERVAQLETLLEAQNDSQEALP